MLSHIGRLFFNLVGDGWDTLVQDALYDVEKEEENRVQLRRAIADGLRHQAQSRQRLRSKGARASFKVCACLHACLLACALPFLTSTVSATRSLTCCFSSRALPKLIPSTLEDQQADAPRPLMLQADTLAR